MDSVEVSVWSILELFYPWSFQSPDLSHLNVSIWNFSNHFYRPQKTSYWTAWFMWVTSQNQFLKWSHESVTEYGAMKRNKLQWTFVKKVNFVCFTSFKSRVNSRNFIWWTIHFSQLIYVQPLFSLKSVNNNCIS